MAGISRKAAIAKESASILKTLLSNSFTHSFLDENRDSL